VRLHYTPASPHLRILAEIGAFVVSDSGERRVRRSAGILYVSDGRLLVLKRSRRVRNSGKWGLPGGKRDGQESAWETAQREMREEIGQGPLAQMLGEVVVDRPGKQYRFFVLRAARKARRSFKPNLNHEHTRSRWVTLDWCMRHLSQLHPVLREALRASDCNHELSRALEHGKGLRRQSASGETAQVRTRAA
jgi:8-oxo-dGTP pyrophosphatase MutT (NUDIX family)